MPMLKPRKNHGSAVLHGRLYVIGGAAKDSHHLRRDGEVYDPTTDQWTLIAELLDVGGIGNAALVPLNGRLHVSGFSVLPDGYFHFHFSSLLVKYCLLHIRRDSVQFLKYYSVDRL